MNTPSQTRARAFVIWLMTSGLFLVTYLLGVMSLLGQSLESRVLAQSDYSTAPPLPLSAVSPGFVLAGLGVMSVLCWWFHGLRRAVTLCAASVVAILLSQVLKRVLERPDLLGDGADFVGNSFPSGHMAVFTALVFVLLCSVPARARTVTAYLALALLGVVIWQLMHFGWHRPSDVIGAIALTISVFMVPLIFAPGLMRSRGRLTRSGRKPVVQSRHLSMNLPGITLIGVVILLGGIVGFLGAVNMDEGRVGAIAAVLTCAGVAVLAIRAALASVAQH